MMEKRLKLAKQLLKPTASVLIVAIDEKEVHRLGLLLEQVFPGSNIQMVSTIIKIEGTGRKNEFSRTNEFLFFVMLGNIQISAGPDNMFDRNGRKKGLAVEWRSLRRRERSSVRGSRKSQFYPVFVDENTSKIHSVGDFLTDDIPRDSIVAPAGTVAVWPLKPNGDEMIWGIVPDSLRKLVAKGYARCHRNKIQFLNSGTVESIENGDAVIHGYDAQGAVIAEFKEGAKQLMPKTVWLMDSHNSQASGTLLVKKFVPGNDFDFPKSLYAVEDALRFFVGNNKEAIILDFFAGTGTTTHAVARLNAQDGGTRRSISITNNEVSAAEAAALKEQGILRGSDEWERHGICRSITQPRLTAAISGTTADGKAVKGKYTCNGKSEMAEGFNENIEFFIMTYQNRDKVKLGAAFDAIAPILWLQAGAQGPRIESASSRWALPEGGRYGILFEPDDWPAFTAAVKDAPTVSHVFIVTDSDSIFQRVAEDLPSEIQTVRLYEDYLESFAINTGWST